MTARLLAVALAFAAFGATPALSRAEAPVAPGPDAATLASFAQPHQMVDIGDGRTLNLVCIGAGKHTVLFEAGGSDWSVIWALVQPLVARRTRACSYDRAGLGYSPPAPGPRSPIAIVDDLHALIRAAALPRPLVLVGHSLGGFDAKLYAALYPEDVAALVLVDPSEERSTERAHDRLRARFGASLASRIELSDNDGLQGLLARYQACAAAAKDGDLDPASIGYRRCSDPPRPALGPVIAAERARIQVRPAYQQAQASEILNSLYARSDGDATYRDLFRPHMFGAMPLVVLSHGNYDVADPAEVAGYESWLWLHRETAALSRIGRQQTAPATNHNIEIDDPAAVADAVDEVLDRLEHSNRAAR